MLRALTLLLAGESLLSGAGGGHRRAPRPEVLGKAKGYEERPAHELLVVVDAHASGVADPKQTGRDLVAVFEALGGCATSVVTSTERELWDCMRAAAGSGYRVALVGGDGSLHAAVNAPLASLPELAIIPAGRANNVARALGIPSDRLGAVRTAAFGPARPLDALLVRTPERSLPTATSRRSRTASAVRAHGVA